jgi:hypothetical protein
LSELKLQKKQVPLQLILLSTNSYKTLLKQIKLFQ